jgi:hypothetical protein
MKIRIGLSTVCYNANSIAANCSGGGIYGIYSLIDCEGFGNGETR